MLSLELRRRNSEFFQSSRPNYVYRQQYIDSITGFALFKYKFLVVEARSGNVKNIPSNIRYDST